eukprot:GHVS01008855.1.p1 GENE.GHVS01008855.1~~GHVS01008855.1.p1  ORF type:complete len:187 (-),score=32.80 GHVS01008855.1:544-1104(-)
MDKALVERVVENSVLHALEENEARVDEEIRKLDNLKEDDLEELREKRLRQLKAQAADRQKFASFGHGSYQELYNEKDFFQAAKQSSMLVVHFYRPSNNHCELVDRAMLTLSGKHVGTRFVKINAEKSQFLCSRLKIWMLPTVVLVKNGNTDHSIVGLDELGGEKFDAQDLEKLLAKFSVIKMMDEK